MPEPRNPVDRGEVLAIFQEIPAESPHVREDTFLALDDYFGDGREVTRTVVGVDIYRYSSYPLHTQRLIPILFKLLYDAAIADGLQRERLLITRDEAYYKERFIPTGDGGFQIVESPLHAIAFMVMLEKQIHAFNTYAIHGALRKFVGPLVVRWALTLDSLFRFENNYFGTAIINNARILAADRLNRCVIDANVLEWFLQRVGTIETLVGLDRANVTSIFGIPDGESMLFPGGLRNIIVQKIGSIGVKDTAVDVHNLFIQANVSPPAGTPGAYPKIVTFGNLNTSGLAS